VSNDKEIEADDAQRQAFQGSWDSTIRALQLIALQSLPITDSEH
jgi:hypothetical protein